MMDTPRCKNCHTDMRAMPPALQGVGPQFKCDQCGYEIPERTVRHFGMRADTGKFTGKSPRS